MSGYFWYNTRLLTQLTLATAQLTQFSPLLLAQPIAVVEIGSGERWLKLTEFGAAGPKLLKQGVALTGRNQTGPPYSVAVEL